MHGHSLLKLNTKKKNSYGIKKNLAPHKKSHLKYFCLGNS